MTACAYFSPNGVANILADTLVSHSIPQQTNLAPIRWAGSSSLEVGISAPDLFRKVYLVGDRTALSFSGGERAIRSLLNEAKELVKVFELEKRPMRWLGDLAEQINESYEEEEKVGVVGATVSIGRDGSLINNIVASKACSSTFPYAGLCHFRGSGASELRQLVQGHDELGTSILENTLRIDGEYERSLCGFLNSEKLRDELGNDGSKNEHWGGFIEHAKFSVAEGKWVRTRSSLHLIYLAHFPQDEVCKFILYKAVAYDSGDAAGKLLILLFSNPQPTALQWSIADLLLEAPKTSFSSGPWIPASVTITVIPCRGLDNHVNLLKKRFCYTLTKFENSSVLFQVDQKNIQLQVRRGLLENFARKIATKIAVRMTGFESITPRLSAPTFPSHSPQPAP